MTSLKQCHTNANLEEEEVAHQTKLLKIYGIPMSALLIAWAHMILGS